MASGEKRSVNEELFFCPIYQREIDVGLCWEICNLGNDGLCLQGTEHLPCEWKEAVKRCEACPHSLEWE